MNGQQDDEILAESAPDGGKTKVKQKRYNGLLEWILDREGHEFLVEVDREFIKDKFNLIGIREKFIKELNLTEETCSEQEFNFLLKHLFKSSAPSKESL